MFDDRLCSKWPLHSFAYTDQYISAPVYSLRPLPVRMNLDIAHAKSHQGTPCR
jgi:hypothetical protein